MSKRYNTIANEFACTLREIASLNSGDHALDKFAGAWKIIHTWCAIERKSNPRFDTDRFVSYINERL